MTRRYGGWLGLGLWICVSGAALAQGDNDTVARGFDPEATSLQRVMESALRHFPLIQAARQNIREREAQVLAAQGAFDPSIDSSVNARLTGFYDGNSVQSMFNQAFPDMNASVFAGYRRAGGSFPSYDGGDDTLDRGELRMGVALSLLRDRDIDERRLRLWRADIEQDAEALRLLSVQVDTLRDAYVSYAAWVFSARLLTAFESLLQIAVTRGEAITRQVEAGESAEILQVENDQAILQRRLLVVDARRQMESAAQQLAVFLRDDSGRSMMPRYEAGLELPLEAEAGAQPDFDPRTLDAIIDRQPEIRIADLVLQQEELERRQAENQARPKLDLRVYAARDFGNGALSLRGNDGVADIVFSVPLQTRSADGRAAAAQARMASVRDEVRFLRDQLETALQVALINVRTTAELEQLAQQELVLAETLASAEVRRFETGLSDFFLLNQRERSVAEADLKLWQAHLSHQQALANLSALSLDFDFFGVEPEAEETAGP